MTRELTDGAVEFGFFRPGVSVLTLVGDFNAWRTPGIAMRSDGDGWWTCRMRLAPGTYRFRYCADGAWFTDYAAFGVEPGPFGWNSVIFVAERPVRTSRSAA